MKKDLIATAAPTCVEPPRRQAKFGVIYADPPWRYDGATQNRAIENHYPTMSLEDICALEVPSADNCVLYLWTTAPKIAEAMKVIEAWGFNYRTGAIWDKEKIGMGYWFRGQHEHLLVATKGTVKAPAPELRVPSILRCGRGKHSSKPDQVRYWIESWFPDSTKLEMFARIQRPGWSAFGNQVETDLLSASPVS